MVRKQDVQPKGEIHLTFAQIAWFISILSAVLWTWGDLRTQLAKIEQRQMGVEQRVYVLEQRNERVGFTQGDADELKKEILAAVRRMR